MVSSVQSVCTSLVFIGNRLALASIPVKKKESNVLSEMQAMSSANIFQRNTLFSLLEVTFSLPIENKKNL